MIKIKFCITLFIFSTQFLFSQNSIDSIFKIIPFLENKTWQINSVESVGQIPEFGLDTSIIYSFGELIIEKNKIKGECALCLKDYRAGEVIIKIMLHYPFYSFLMSWNADKIKLDYEDEEFSDEILEINERVFRIKRSYKPDEYNSILITFKKLR